MLPVSLSRLVSVAAMTVLCLVAGGAAAAQSMVSIKGETVNMRSGPGRSHEIRWELPKGYPLKVLKRQGSWLYVSDFERDRGWVARSLTGSTPHHVVSASRANIRRGPGVRHPVVGRATRGEVLRTRGKSGDWVRIERTDGQTGWVARRLLWGW